MKTFIATINEAPYKETEIEELNGACKSEWKGLIAPIELDIWSESTVTILFFEDASRQISSLKNLEGFFIFKKDLFLTAAGFQKKYNLAREICKLPITHIAIKRDFCEVFFNSDDEFSLEDLKMLAHLNFNVAMNIIDDDTVMEVFMINNYEIKKKKDAYTVFKP